MLFVPIKSVINFQSFLTSILDMFVIRVISSIACNWKILKYEKLGSKTFTMKFLTWPWRVELVPPDIATLRCSEFDWLLRLAPFRLGLKYLMKSKIWQVKSNQINHQLLLLQTRKFCFFASLWNIIFIIFIRDCLK